MALKCGDQYSDAWQEVGFGFEDDPARHGVGFVSTLPDGKPKRKKRRIGFNLTGRK